MLNVYWAEKMTSRGMECGRCEERSVHACIQKRKIEERERERENPF